MPRPKETSNLRNGGFVLTKGCASQTWFSPNVALPSTINSLTTSTYRCARDAKITGHNADRSFRNNCKSRPKSPVDLHYTHLTWLAWVGHSWNCLELAVVARRPWFACVVRISPVRETRAHCTPANQRIFDIAQCHWTIHMRGRMYLCGGHCQLQVYSEKGASTRWNIMSLFEFCVWI